MLIALFQLQINHDQVIFKENIPIITVQEVLKTVKRTCLLVIIGLHVGLPHLNRKKFYDVDLNM